MNMLRHHGDELDGTLSVNVGITLMYTFVTYTSDYRFLLAPCFVFLRIAGGATHVNLFVPFVEMKKSKKTLYK